MMNQNWRDKSLRCGAAGLVLASLWGLVACSSSPAPTYAARPAGEVAPGRPAAMPMMHPTATAAGSAGGDRYPGMPAPMPAGPAPMGYPPSQPGMPMTMDPVSEAMMMTTLNTEDQQLEPASRYSLSVREESVRNVLLALGRQSPYNFVVAPEVEGLVSVDLREVPLQRLLDAITGPLGLSYRLDGDMIWVQTISTNSEFFTLNYVITERTASRTVTGNTIAGSGTFDTGGSNSGVDAVSGSERTAIFESIQDGIRLLMSAQGKVNLSPESGMVTVVDYRENLVRVEKFLARVTESINRQVMISAKLVEVSYAKNNEFGIDWSAVMGDFSVNVASRTTGAVLEAVLDTDKVTAVIQALAEKQNVAIKNSPNVSALNNQAAIIILGEQEVFFETVEDLDQTTGAVLRRRTSPRSVTIGVSLHVVPQISREGMIVMNVHQRVTEKIGEAVGSDGTRVPELSVREVDTIARLRNGQTMVIAGLTSERDSKATSGVPILSDVPLLGAAFTTRRNEKRKTELVLFLTPTLVTP